MSPCLAAPIDVQIEITERCNLRCGHCYNYWRKPDTPPGAVMSATTEQIIVQRLREEQVLSATITGGEPFAARTRLWSLVDNLLEDGMKISLNTNLLLATKDDLQRLARARIPLLVSLLSSDADQYEQFAHAPHGSFTRLLTNLRYAAELGISFSVNMVVTPASLPGMHGAAKLARELGASTFCATKAVPHEVNEFPVLNRMELAHMFDELMRIEADVGIPVETLVCNPHCALIGTPAFDRFGHRRCVAAKTTCTINVRGEVRPCPHISTNAGSLMEQELREIWRSMSDWRCGDHLPTTCRNCPIVGRCTGGCRANSNEPYDSLDMHASPHKVAQLVRTVNTEHVPSTFSNDNAQQRVQFKDDIRFRAEPFGAIIVSMRPWSLVAINATAAAFLQPHHANRTSFTGDEFVASSPHMSQAGRAAAERLFQRLLSKELLTKVDDAE